MLFSMFPGLSCLHWHRTGHITTDLAKLEMVSNAAWEAILTPLHAIAHPGAPPMGTAHTLAEDAGEEQ
jgi:hypothetical protein